MYIDTRIHMCIHVNARWKWEDCPWDFVWQMDRTNFYKNSMLFETGMVFLSAMTLEWRSAACCLLLAACCLLLIPSSHPLTFFFCFYYFAWDCYVRFRIMKRRATAAKEIYWEWRFRETRQWLLLRREQKTQLLFRATYNVESRVCTF